MRTMTVVLLGVALSSETLAQSANYTSTEAVSGRQVQIGYYAGAKKDCSPAPLPTVRSVEPPKYGTLTVRRAILTTNQIPNCRSLKLPSQVVFYTSKAGYVGPDRLVYEVTSFAGEKSTFDVTITVKEAPEPRPPGGEGNKI